MCEKHSDSPVHPLTCGQCLKRKECSNEYKTQHVCVFGSVAFLRPVVHEGGKKVVKVFRLCSSAQIFHN